MKSTASKPVPSQGRADKYPPPLMRFLRSNVGNRRRGRSGSRATSLFLRRKRTTSSSSSTAIEAHQQEPSSPKVTCIGQVRVRRSSSAQSRKLAPKKGAHPRRPNPGNNSHFCYSFHFDLCPRRRQRLQRPGCFRRQWRKWASFFHCTKIRVRTDSSKKGSVKLDSNGDEDEDGKRASAGESLNRVIGSGAPPTPPKNAFLLTRSSSAPHRSSYLPNRFWGSLLKTEECKIGEQENRGSTAGEEEVGPLEIEQISRDNDAESRTDPGVVGKVEICREDAEEEGEAAVEGGKQSETERGWSLEGPVVLTRSKSEPASMWRERRLESTFSSSSSTHSVENK